MFSSIRIRLTFWYLGVLALIVVAFAAASYFLVARNLDQTINKNLAEMAHNVEMDLRKEETDIAEERRLREAETAESLKREEPDEDEDKQEEAIPTIEEAISEEIGDLRFRDYWFAIFDQDGQQIASTIPDSRLQNSLKNSPAEMPFADASGENDSFRVCRVSFELEGKRFKLFVTRSLGDQTEFLDSLKRIFYFAVPIALLLAGLGGYFLARRSLTHVTDPVTGELAFEIPLEAAAAVVVEENPFSAEFGQFTGGVTNLQTKGGGDKFKISAARFFPTFRNVFSTKVDSFRPRITASGALIEKRLFYLQSFEYRFRRDLVPNLPKPENNTTIEGFNAFSQIDWIINQRNSLKFNFAVFPSKIRNLNLDTFNPPAVSPNYKQRGILISVSEQTVFKDSSFLSSEISYKTFDVDVFAKSTELFTITPEINRGGYFADTRRQTSRWQWREVYFSHPLKFNGQHSIKTGIELFKSEVKGVLNYSSIFIRRLDETLAQRIDFQPGAPLGFSYHEFAAFAQDRWTINPKITLDYGFRFDRDGVTRRNNFSPRFSVLYSPSKSGRTIIRGGIGVFYDRSSAVGGTSENEISDEVSNLSPNFEQIPRRIVTNFAADGQTIIDGARLFAPQIIERLRTPQSVRWSIQLDQKITNEVTARFGYLKRAVKNDLLFEPVIVGNTGTVNLSSRARSRYDELQFVMAYNKPNFGQWSASYVFSRARGDLNTADKIYGDTPAFIWRSNQYAPLSFDAPHRFLFYGQIDLPRDTRIAPLFEARSGFPFSAFDASLNFVGGRNLAGRFPKYLSLDLQITKGVKLPFFDNKKARVGVALFNLTNHFNPRDVQSNLTSPNFGQFSNSLGTAIKAKFDIEF